MFDLNLIQSILENPEVISFIPSYIATKGLDGLLNGTSPKQTIGSQLVICLNKALHKTCNHFEWEYDSEAITETFLYHWGSIKTVDTSESLSSIIEKAVGRSINSEVLEYWTHSFNEAVSDPQYLHLSTYLSRYNSKTNQPPTPTFPRYITLKAPPINVEFSYRDDIVKELRKTITQNKKLALISGLGGIGKTSIAKALYHEVEGEFKHIAWVEYQDSIEESLLNSFTLFNDVEDKASRYEKIINFLQSATRDTIIFIDNISNDDGMDFIERLDVNVVLTSRLEEIGNFELFTIDFLSEEQCVDIFYKYYKTDKDRLHINTVCKLVKLVKCHMLSVELLARAANIPGYSLEEYAKELEATGFKYPTLNVKTGHTAISQTIAKHLIKLFELVSVNDEQKRILINFSRMPSIEIPGEVRNWLGCNDINDLIGLTKLGWLAVSDTGYEMHPIIKEAIQLQYENVEYKDFESIIKYMSGDDYINDIDVYTKVHTRLSIAESIMDCLKHIEIEEVALLFNNIAFVFGSHGNYAKALEWHHKTFEIKEKLLGLEHPDTATSYNNIGFMYCRQGDYAKALERYQKALEIFGNTVGVEHPYAAATYSCIGFIFANQGDYLTALELYQKALKIDEKVLGLEHPSTATSYNNIASVFNDKGDYEKSLELHKKALEIREKVLGLEHPDTAISYNNIGIVYDSQGDYAKALEWYQKALEIEEKVLGLEHPNTIITMENITIVKDSLKHQ